jgi:Secretion system C-terminal sorting domain
MKTLNKNTKSETRNNWKKGINKLYFFFTALLFVTFISSFSRADNPEYELCLRNFELADTLGGMDNVLFFDIFVKHTNFQQSGPFQFSYGQYFFNFNPNIANGGTLSLQLIPDLINPAISPRIPPSGAIAGNQIRLVANSSLSQNGPIIDPNLNGTRVVKIRLATTAPEFAHESLGIEWRTSAYGNPYTKVFANAITNELAGTYCIDSSGLFALPVELQNFSSIVDQNNVTLNWSTSSETNNSGFDVERKLVSSNDWSKVNNISGNGTTTEEKNYTYTERLNTGKYNYRLKQIDLNGNFKYYNLANEIEIGVPSKFDLSQNYPNPFNPTTKIDYDIPQDGKVSLILYDMSGKEVAKLVDEVKTAGYYTLQFNGSNLASGIYFYRLTAQGGNNNFVNTKKMVIIK